MGWMYVAIGGALGALLRFGLTGWVQNLTAGTFPWGTITVNVLGSLILGFAVGWLESTAMSVAIRHFALIGVLGAFTTFSTFAFEAVALLRDGDWWAASVYVAGSVLAGFLGALLGFELATRLLRSWR